MSNGGIKIEQIENYKECKSTIKHLVCYVCLDIAIDPYECAKCEVLFCRNCLEVIKISGKECITPNCTDNIKKGNKIIREMLSVLKIKCFACNKYGMNYKEYTLHISNCSMYLKNPLATLFNEIHTLNQQIIEKTKELEGISMLSSKYKGFIKKNKSPIEMTFELNVNQKMELYNACVEGKLEEFKNLIFIKKYPILEEISAKNYYWSPLHYAMHYGREEIIMFILDYLKKNNSVEYAISAKSNDGRCPLLCLLKSNSINVVKKKKILDLIISNYKVNISDEVKKEIQGRKLNENIINN